MAQVCLERANAPGLEVLYVVKRSEQGVLDKITSAGTAGQRSAKKRRIKSLATAPDGPRRRILRRHVHATRAARTRRAAVARA